MALPEPDRLREEDPYTDAWTAVAPTRVVVHRSRFEIDLNRPRDQAVYQSPEDAWGLDVWGGALPPGLVAASLELYDEFYGLLDGLVAAAIAEAGVAVVLDCHSYNHRRAGPDAPQEPHEDNPEINVGTGTVDQARWGRAVEAFNAALRAQDLDARENVRFRGGHLSRHVNTADRALALALEFKKTWMDEWTGERDGAHQARLVAALDVAVGPLLAAVLP
jgi:N-formylglutamate deformylase